MKPLGQIPRMKTISRDGRPENLEQETRLPGWAGSSSETLGRAWLVRGVWLVQSVWLGQGAWELSAADTVTKVSGHGRRGQRAFAQ